ncbi:hypothetical protein CHS0354_005480 [Potamilus streckersoni]|uniref:TIR domain-containing protein n=1 Tax=Potamilus streckersoni TaxID=2493646 RepID=A0AAE0SFP8_9BIVA|nr:hypothetical protein CHS0354_005480 [Potamilus streckersoni]
MDLLKQIWNTIIKFYFKEFLEYLQKHNSDTAIVVIFVACAVYYSREGFFLWGEFILYTCCVLIGFLLVVFITANCRKVNFLRESPSPVDRSKTENERPSHQSDASDTTNREISDIIILHTEDPRKEVYNFKNHLQSVITLNNFRVDLIDEIGAGRGKLGIMDHVLMNYRLVFVYLSEDFKEDWIAMFNSELSIVENLTKGAKLGRVIPIWPSKIIKNNRNCPKFIEGIIGIQYYDYFDEQFKSSYIKQMNDLVLKGREKYLKD